ncbi:hypothetical protein [Limnospira fusiformis]|uniref:hypothetical protein n=1 Tax=Limnospira fusiformis TaxID=54297 RepID=UPI002AA138AB|nr:hypothetical protein [Limnospira fusiformis LS22]
MDKYLSQFPILSASKVDKKAMEFIVNKYRDTKGVEVEDWEAKIDDMVAHIYGLTAEKIKI